MAITLPDDLSEQLQQLAQQQNMTPEALLRQMLNQQSDYYSPVRVKQRLYDRARRYWQAHGDRDRAALTNQELAVSFWGFDQDDIPRLKSDSEIHDVAPNPLLQMAENALGAEHPHDTASHFDDVLHEVWRKHPLKTRNHSDPWRIDL